MPSQLVLLAQQAEEAPWFLFPLLALIGLIVIGAGVYGITNERALLPARQKLLLKLFGVDAVTGKWARVIGFGQCFTGIGLLIVALTGPFWAGSLADKPNQAGQGGTQGAADDAWRAGHPIGELFTDAAPDGGLLVGLRCAKGKNWGGALQSVQPIYQVGTKYSLGKLYGPAGGEEHQLIAKPGYAVGALKARAGAVLNALQLVFYRIDGRALDARDRYESPWIGSDGGGEYHVELQGQPVVGIFGSLLDDVTSIGLRPTKKLSRKIADPTEEPPDIWSQPRPGAILGGTQGNAFTALAPDKGILVGLRAFCDSQDSMALRAVQPIYLVGDRYVEGDQYGEFGDFELVTLARPGFCVGGLVCSHVGSSISIKVQYLKMTSSGPIKQDRYRSQWLGYPLEHEEQQTEAEGQYAVGITGHAGAAITGLGLILVNPRKVNASLTPSLPAEYRQIAFAAPPLRAGSPQGTAFRDDAPANGLLVGLRCFKGPNWGGAIQAVQPIYQVGEKYVEGVRHGSEGGQTVEILAKPGYAIGGLNARAGIALNAVQVVFYRIDGKQLDLGQRETSEWVGADGGGPFQLDAEGKPITGIFGTRHEDLISLGLQPSYELFEPVPLVKSNPEGRNEFRTWTSADGKFSVEARLVEIDGDSIKLERRDGSQIAVLRSKLSASDQSFLQR